jgi:hypothetical protein
MTFFLPQKGISFGARPTPFRAAISRLRCRARLKGAHASGSLTVGYGGNRIERGGLLHEHVRGRLSLTEIK